MNVSYLDECNVISEDLSRVIDIIVIGLVRVKHYTVRETLLQFLKDIADWIFLLNLIPVLLIQTAVVIADHLFLIF